MYEVIIENKAYEFRNLVDVIGFLKSIGGYGKKDGRHSFSLEIFPGVYVRVKIFEFCGRDPRDPVYKQILDSLEVFRENEELFNRWIMKTIRVYSIVKEGLKRNRMEISTLYLQKIILIILSKDI